MDFFYNIAKYLGMTGEVSVPIDPASGNDEEAARTGRGIPPLNIPDDVQNLPSDIEEYGHLLIPDATANNYWASGGSDADSESASDDGEIFFPSEELRMARAAKLGVDPMNHATIHLDGQTLTYVPASQSVLMANRTVDTKRSPQLFAEPNDLCKVYGVEISQIAEVIDESHYHWAIYLNPQDVDASHLIQIVH